MKKTFTTMIMALSFIGLQASTAPRVFVGVDPTHAPPASTAIEEDILRQPSLQEAKKYAERNLHIESGKVEFWDDRHGETPTQITTQSEWTDFVAGKDRLRISSSSK